ncbi:hypothetical protein O6H91_11G075200 [Diphasiastrum complanatum]|uniref:Uncharacterized protein n=1 Tax=Diphasiastrum complanatum TaxID=34168 RepID=A0ACC2CAI9_DIPCM|nr:hypothetical protein O6H91_Y255900 [Diphasiastrum complanatum]KAJ7539053.1 hypothetical protein O6H91_11G075200 [Diphasiastrum complanatum]
MQSYVRSFKPRVNLSNMEVLNSPRSTLQLLSPSEVTSRLSSPAERVEKLVTENPVVVFAMSSCCMCHVVKRLFFSLGVNPTVYELDTEPGGAEIEKALSRLGSGQTLPAIYVGGKLIGSLDRLMTAHISGTLVPQLKEAGALWL